jgi:hypothetical protein
MADDQVRLDVRSGFEGLKNRVTVPDGVLKCAAAIVILRRGAALDAVLNPLQAADSTGGRSDTNVQRWP